MEGYTKNKPQRMGLEFKPMAMGMGLNLQPVPG